MKIERPSLLHPKPHKPFVRTNFTPVNFAVVDEFLFRSSLPSFDELKYLTENYHITDVLNVSNNCPEIAFQNEQEAIRTLHLGNHLMPSETDSPSKTNIENFLNLTRKLKTEKPNAKLLLHCNAGADRTGTYVLFYELFNKLKTFNEAVQEMLARGHWPEAHPKLIPNITKLVKEMKL